MLTKNISHNTKKDYVDFKPISYQNTSFYYSLQKGKNLNSIQNKYVTANDKPKFHNVLPRKHRLIITII